MRARKLESGHAPIYLFGVKGAVLFPRTQNRLIFQADTIIPARWEEPRCREFGHLDRLGLPWKTDCKVKGLGFGDKACPVDCIHPKKDEPGFDEAPHLYVDPEACIDCGACIPVCPTNSVYALDDLPAELAQFAGENAGYYSP